MYRSASDYFANNPQIRTSSVPVTTKTETPGGGSITVTFKPFDKLAAMKETQTGSATGPAASTRPATGLNSRAGAGSVFATYWNQFRYSRWFWYVVFGFIVWAVWHYRHDLRKLVK